MNADRVFRFAPSPNGDLHLGHALSCLLNRDMARAAGARLLLRLEDIDRARCSLAFERRIEEDVRWLGAEPDAPPRRQSEHFDDYRSALGELREAGLLYPAFMTRGEVRRFVEEEEEATGTSWPRDPDGAPLYPALDRDSLPADGERRIAAGEPHVFRLHMEKAIRHLGPLRFLETGDEEFGEVEVEADPRIWGDVVLARRDTPTSYHLAVVVDDGLQGVTDVVRGRDLLAATSVHRVLQALLHIPVPRYHHHRLLLGDDGRKLSKSDGAESLRAWRERGATARDVRRMVGLG